MARVTAAEVKLIIETDLPDATVDAFIDSATKLVDQYIADATCHGTDSLKQVELWLSAHLLSIRDKALSSEKLGDAQDTQRAPGVLLKGLDSSFWGQMARAFDCSGTLADSGKRGVQVVTFGGAGTDGYTD